MRSDYWNIFTAILVAAITLSAPSGHATCFDADRSDCIFISPFGERLNLSSKDEYLAERTVTEFVTIIFRDSKEEIRILVDELRRDGGHDEKFLTEEYWAIADCRQTMLGCSGICGGGVPAPGVQCLSKFDGIEFKYCYCGGGSNFSMNGQEASPCLVHIEN